MRKLNAGKRPVQEIVAATADGSLANVFVSLQGSFPAIPVPAEPVTIDQRACMYVPRVVGARVGQTVQVRNSDELLHNVHGVSAHGNGFNISQPKAGIVQQLPLKTPEIMLRVTCDVHRWMTAFVGVVSHPYFATTGVAGTYTIDNVPAGHPHHSSVARALRRGHPEGASDGRFNQHCRFYRRGDCRLYFGSESSGDFLPRRSSARAAPRMPSIVTKLPS